MGWYVTVTVMMYVTVTLELDCVVKIYLRDIILMSNYYYGDNNNV